MIPPNPFRRSISDASLRKDGHGEYPEGWSKEDEEDEREFMARGLVNWGEMRSGRFWVRRDWWSECPWGIAIDECVG